MGEAPIVPAPAPPDAPLLFYRRGKRWPRAIAWFGFKSFWGHLWHLGASVVATEDIDCRDWMHPDEPDALTARIAGVIGAAKPHAASLTEAVEGDVWIDFVADTGDDFSVSKAVARLIFAEYEVDGVHLPRGHMLVFGGDTAYPVATDIEIHNRIVVPFGQILRHLDDGRTRALLGIPGNHDWFSGLDGFGRMFRGRRTQQKLDRSSIIAPAADSPTSRRNEGQKDDEVDRLGQIGHVIEWVEAFRLGRFVIKRAALALRGYTPVQSASYWAIRLAPDLDFWGIDRQLRLVDFHQRGYFAEVTDESRGVVLCMADPVYAFLEPNPNGVRALQSLDLSIERDGLLVMTGDTHHYCRQDLGEGMHVIAGGGGAFLHPACIARGGLPAPAAEFPGRTTSIALALQVPWQIVHGRSGFLVHVVVALTYLPLFGAQWSTGNAGTAASIVTALVVAVACLLLGGWRQKAKRIGLLAVATGVAFGFLPLAGHELVHWGSLKLSLAPAPLHLAGAAYALSVYGGTLAIGTYLMLLTLLGIEQHQAFSALAHPGYKHFVRMRVRRDGSGVDGWVLGRVDPLSQKDKVVLVDRFFWKNPKHKAS